MEHVFNHKSGFTGASGIESAIETAKYQLEKTRMQIRTLVTELRHC